jgi:DNA-binding response OmpR family regulator
MAQQILIVEDELELAKVLRDYLERSGYKARIVCDGDLANASIFSNITIPDLISHR